MRGDHALEFRRALAWLKGNAFFITFGLLTLLVIVALLNISPQPQTLQTNNSANQVRFAVHSLVGGNTFTISAEIDLSDGMDRAEARRVAAKVTAKVVEGNNINKRPPIYASSTTYMGDEGTWKVELYSVYSSSRYCVLNHLFTRFKIEYFVVVINPSSRTVEYARF